MADDQRDHSEPVAVASFTTEGEAEVAQAMLRAYGIEALFDDQVEGGALEVEGEPGVVLVVRAGDAMEARGILSAASDDATEAEAEAEAEDEADAAAVEEGPVGL